MHGANRLCLQGAQVGAAVSTRIDPDPVAPGFHPIEAYFVEGVVVCTNCGAIVFESLTQRHRLNCEPRQYDLDPLLEHELVP